MIVPLEKPGTPEELVHFGIKGMRWGVRNVRTSGPTSSKLANWSINSHYARSSARTQRRKEKGKTGPKPSTRIIRGLEKNKKKIAIGVGVTATVAVGSIFAAKYLRQSGGTKYVNIPKRYNNDFRFPPGFSQKTVDILKNPQNPMIPAHRWTPKGF